MAFKKLFLQLKNGKTVTTFYRKNNTGIYTLELSYNNADFILHSYIFEGNDVLDETCYTTESEVRFNNFNDLIQYLTNDFRGLYISKITGNR